MGITNKADLLETEQRNALSVNLDKMSINEIIVLMNNENLIVNKAIEDCIEPIGILIRETVTRLQSGGRLFYMGAGTSGRLGVLDAAECVPTFNTPPDLVQGIIAGGNEALINAVEGAEDSVEQGILDLKERHLTHLDVVIGITASGTTPYVAGGLKYANEMGAVTGLICNNKHSLISKIADHAIELLTGPEILTGSTRLKAGSAQKNVLNMISTITMVQLGKVYENLMIDVQSTNNKLVDRSKRIVMEATSCDYETATYYLEHSEASIKLAIIRIMLEISLKEAKALLDSSGGQVKKAMESIK